MERNIFETLHDAVEAVEEGYGEQDLVLLPPPNDQYGSDEEVGDDDIGLAGNIDLPTDVTGVVEVHCANVDSDDDDDSDEPADDVRWAFLRINLKL